MRTELIAAVDRALRHREPSLVQRALLAAVGIFRPGVIATREEERRRFHDGVRVSVRAYNDDDPDEFRRITYGDWWLREGLLTALGESGFIVTNIDPDVVIHLHGRALDLPGRARRILWVHDNPDRLVPGNLNIYERVFSASRLLTERLREQGVPADFLPLATALTPRATAKRFDVSFVGNARPSGHRPVIDHLGDGFDLKVWGNRFRSLPAGAWMGPYVPYHDLPDVYSASIVSLNDHYEAMIEAGIVSPRVYDILASGGFCISDANPGLTEIFGDAVPQYRSAGELRELVRHFLAHPDDRLARMRVGREIALSSRWSDRSRSLMSSLGYATPPSTSPTSAATGA